MQSEKKNKIQRMLSGDKYAMAIDILCLTQESLPIYNPIWKDGNITVI